MKIVFLFLKIKKTYKCKQVIKLKLKDEFLIFKNWSEAFISHPDEIGYW